MCVCECEFVCMSVHLCGGLSVFVCESEWVGGRVGVVRVHSWGRCRGLNVSLAGSPSAISSDMARAKELAAPRQHAPFPWHRGGPAGQPLPFVIPLIT